MSILNKILDLVKTLTPKEFTKFKKLIMEHIDTYTTLFEHTENLRFSNGRVCPICGSIHVVRNGHRADGKQRFICRDCGKIFVINSKTFKMPREAYKRGNSVDKRGLSKKQVCVVCAVNRNGLSYAKVGKLGKANKKCIAVTLDNRIKEVVKR